jgi:osmotically-inducible protein OsmY
MRSYNDDSRSTHAFDQRNMKRIVDLNVDHYVPQFDRRHPWRSGEYTQQEKQERGWLDRAGDEVLSWFGDDYAERRRRHDGPHRGKGPKGYQRSDERIKEDINDRLTDEWNIDASDITVTVENGDVILSGFVKDRFQKRRAADVSDDVSGVRNVENRIKVDASG